MRILINTLGSAGDAYPFLAIGRALKARGHEVIALANTEFRASVEASGLRFFANGSREQLVELTRNPDLWHPRRGLELVLRRGVVPTLRPHYDALRELVVPGNTVVVTGVMAMGSRLLREKLGPKGGVPLVTVHLAPSAFQSVHRAPRFAGLWMPDWMPRMLKASTFRVADRMVDRFMAPQFNALRRELGLRPAKRLFKAWAHSPDALLCLWPEWFGPRQPDWPEHATLAGFILNDEAEQRPLEPALEAWLDNGAPPILFAAGSANLTPRTFFAQAVDAARQLGRRALLVSPAPEVASLAGGDVFHSSYAPFSRVLPRADVFVGHGGIGSCAQGLAAGVPQLVTPRAYDQFDNASRLEDLGAGACLPASRFTARRAAEAIGALLTSPTVGDACRRAREAIAAENALKRACEVIEWARVAPG